MLMRLVVPAAVVLLAAPAFAAEPTVTLTQSELRQLITAQVTAAIAQQAVQKANSEAAEAEKKVNEAFASKALVEPAKPAAAKH